MHKVIIAILLFGCFGFNGCKITSSTTEKADKLDNAENGCLAAPEICPQIYMPASCSLTSNGTIYEKHGSNTCEAKASLKAELCANNIQFELNAIKCVLTDN